MTNQFVFVRNSLVALAISTSSFGNVAWSQATAPNLSSSPEILARQPDGETSSTSLIGIKVVNDAGEVVGDVNYLLVNAAGQITTVVVGVGGFLGVGEKNVAFRFVPANITSDKGDRTLKLSVTKDQLQAAAKFEWRETPMEVKVEDSVRSAADKVKAAAKSLSDKASDAMKKN